MKISKHRTPGILVVDRASDTISFEGGVCLNAGCVSGELYFQRTGGF